MAEFSVGRRFDGHPVIRLIYTIFFMVGAIFAPVPFPFKVPLFALIALLIVWLETGDLRAIGLAWPRRLAPTALWAIGVAFFVVVVLGEILNPFIERLADHEANYSGYGELEGNLEGALRLLAYAFVSAMIAEEIVYRGFLLHELNAIFGESAMARWAVILLGALVFGLAHYSQGPVGVISIVFVGIAFGWAFFRSGRNLWALMIAHAMIDIWGVSMLYLGR